MIRVDKEFVMIDGYKSGLLAELAGVIRTFLSHGFEPDAVLKAVELGFRIEDSEKSGCELKDELTENMVPFKPRIHREGDL